MLVGFASTNARFRDRTDSLVVYQLQRKKCACGKVITSKQLNQYGHCSGCHQLRATPGVRHG